MARISAVRLVCAVLALAASACAGAQTWSAGKHYFPVNPQQRTSVPAGKVEVLEVFSYGCPACNAFLPTMKRLKASLPPNAQLGYLPASYIPSEDWPMFQRAFFAAQALGIAEKTHEPMFEAVWKTGELSTVDPGTQRLKNPQPSIEDAARFYARVGGVTAADFLATAKSFGVDSRMRAADAQIIASRALSTPTIIVNGKYRLTAESAGGYDQVIELVKYLVAQESGAGTAAGKSAAPK